MRHLIAAAALALLATPVLAAAALPAPSVAMSGRTAVVSLPYRSAEGMVWVAATRMADGQPFMFKGLDIKPHGGPGGTDLAVFTYAADKAGAATLKFGLVPPGKMLIGPPSLVYSGPVAARYEAKVSAK